MTTLSQSRVSPEAITSTTTNTTNSNTMMKDESSPSCTASSGGGAAAIVPRAPRTPPHAPPSKRSASSRFRRRKRSSGATAPTYTRSHSMSSQLSVDSSTNGSASAPAAPGGTVKPKKRSIFKRLLGKSSSKKSLVIETHAPTSAAEGKDCANGKDTADGKRINDETQGEDDFTEIDMLEEQGQQLRLAGQTDEALAMWEEALSLVEPFAASHQCKSNQIRCRMIDLHMRLATAAASSNDNMSHHNNDLHLKHANKLIAELEPLKTNDNSASCLEASPLLMDMLTSNSCWTYALQVSHQMPETEPLTLARLHLEVAQQSDRPISHLNECHQLLLSVDNDKKSSGLLDTLWQELAQAYGNMGEDEMALGCSQSRMEHLSSPQQIALAHYDQALNVYSPVAQYGLALKEAELALSALQRHEPNDKTPAQGKDEEDESELLLVKLYQFKADVQCRMGRINDSIQSYEQLLQAYLDSTTFGPVEAANVLYVLGKLSVRCKRFRAALEYFDRELQMTKSVVGQNHLAISKIYHEQAKVADAGLMDYPLAIRYYEDALRVESSVYHQAKSQQQDSGATLAAGTLLQDAKNQMGETKQCLGKLHFKMGDFATAVRTTLAVDK